MTTHPIPCTEVIEQLWDYLDSQLPTERIAGIREHLEACAGCRAVSEFEQAFLRAVHGVLEAEGSTDEELRRRVLTTLAARGYRE